MFMKKTIGRILRFLHLIFGVLMSVASLLLSGDYLIFLISFLIFVISLNILFKGCLVTKIEYLLTKENQTIIDPVLSFFNMRLTNKNRYRTTLLIAVQIFLISIYRYIRWIRIKLIVQQLTDLEIQQFYICLLPIT